MDDGFNVQLLGRQQRKTILQVEPHLMTEYAQRSRSGTVGFARPVLANTGQKIEILLHEVKSTPIPYAKHAKHGKWRLPKPTAPADPW